MQLKYSVYWNDGIFYPWPEGCTTKQVQETWSFSMVAGFTFTIFITSWANWVNNNSLSWVLSFLLESCNHLKSVNLTLAQMLVKNNWRWIGLMWIFYGRTINCNNELKKMNSRIYIKMNWRIYNNGKKAVLALAKACEGAWQKMSNRQFYFNSNDTWYTVRAFFQNLVLQL